MSAETESTPDERTLKLSLYIDGELPEAERATVEARIKNDPAWKAEYQALADSELKIEHVASAEEDWHDADFTARVSSKIRAMPKPSGLRSAGENLANEPRADGNAGDPTGTAPQPKGTPLRDAPPQRGPNLVRVALHLGFLLVAIGLFIWKFGMGGSSSTNSGEKNEGVSPTSIYAHLQYGTFDNGVPTDSASAEDWTSGHALAAKTDGTLLLTGGMPVFVSADTRLQAGNENVPVLTVLNGALFWPKATPSMRNDFSKIKLPDGTEIEAPQGGLEVRVKEKIIRAIGVTITVKNASRTLYIPDGFAAKADLSGSEAYDPREIGARWSSLVYLAGISEGATFPAPEFAAVWPQLHGDAGHSGHTPFKGPAGIGAAGFFAWDVADSDNKSPEVKPSGPAIALSRRDFYVAVTLDANRTRLYSVNVNDQKLTTWKALGTALNGPSTIAPVLSPEGLIAIGTNGAAGGASAVVQVWDTKLNRVAFTKDLGTTLAGITVARLNGKTQFLCSTFKGLIALDETQKETWIFSGVTDLSVPACVGPDGVIVVLSKSGRMAALDADGKALSLSRLDPYGALRAPVYVPTESGGYFQAFTEQGQEATVDASGKAGPSLSGRFQGNGRWMLATRIFSQANSVLFPLQEMGEIKLPLPGSISALAQDADGFIYASLGRTVFRIDSKHLTTAPESDKAEKGTIIPGGIAILPKRVLVTTTEGLAIFE